jgi:anthranilate synthase component 1
VSAPAYSLSLEQFRHYAGQGNVIPLYREILADYETPVSAFAKIDHGPSAYLLESIEGGEKWARYSFLGSGSPVVIYEDRGDLIQVRGKRKKRILSRGNPLERLREVMAAYHPVTVPDLPRFVGGAVGYLSYDMVRTFEELPVRQKDHTNLPDFAFLLTDTLLIFDNVSHKIKVVANAHVASTRERDVREAYRAATDRIERMIARLKRPLARTRPHRRRLPITFTSNMNRADFEKMVTRTKEYIRSGDVVQAVLSQRWETNVQASPLQLYRALYVLSACGGA